LICRAFVYTFLDFSAVLSQFGLQLSDLLIQYDAQKGCRPFFLCMGDADGRATFDEYFSAVTSQLSEEVPPPWLLQIITTNLPSDYFYASFIMVHTT
jgi:hypothetical protein